MDSVQVPPQQGTLVWVRLDTCGASHLLYVELDPHLEDVTGLCVDDALLVPDEDGLADTIVKISSAHPKFAECITFIGEVTEGEVVQPDGRESEPNNDMTV